MTDAPITIPAPYRAVHIATIHSAGVFMAENPALPMPENMTLSGYATSRDVLQEIATAYEAPIKGANDLEWVSIPIAVHAVHGIDITYTVFYRHPAPDTTPMDLPPRGEGITTDPWADVAPHWRGRCDAKQGEYRCAHPSGHGNMHFFDDDETNGEHGA